MTNDVIDSLERILKDNICTFEKASFDKKNKKSMCNSSIKAVNCDKIKDLYCKKMHFCYPPKSNDALYICDEKEWYFIEFKNGFVEKADIYRKIYDTLILFIELNIIKDFNFSRNNIGYILVFNDDKAYHKSKSRKNIYSHIFSKANEEEKLFDIEKFEGYLFKETHTYTKEDFNSVFLKKIESR